MVDRGTCVSSPAHLVSKARQLKVPFAFANSSIGKKWIVALTGLVMFLFVIGHMVGNLQFFLGPEAINNYGQLLRTSPELLWLIRLFLLFSLTLHVVFTLWLVVENRRARPQKYIKQATVQVKPSTRLMAISGMLLLVFIIFHLLHFTAQKIDPSYAGFHDEKGRHDIFRMVVNGFSNPFYSGFYAVAMVFLCSHLSHGAWSWMQTVGLRTKKIADTTSHGARILAVALMAGYLSIPAAVLLAGFGKGYVAERVRAQQSEGQETHQGLQITPASGATIPPPSAHAEAAEEPGSPAASKPAPAPSLNQPPQIPAGGPPVPTQSAPAAAPPPAAQPPPATPPAPPKEGE
jgi:succinate dehydrogenase / fumarate reductase cytochrome b subunit